jgi:cytochrome c oxidase subunit 4
MKEVTAMDSNTHGKDHVPHVLPFSTYLRTWLSLLALTGLTVAVSYVNFGAANVWIALLVATLKASVVALVFMHLYWDHKFHAVILCMSLVFLAVFIGFTMFDTETRGRADSMERDRPADPKNPFAGTRTEQAIRKRWSGR